MKKRVGIKYGSFGLVSYELKKFAEHKVKSRAFKNTIIAYGRNIQVGTLKDKRCLRPWIIIVCESEFKRHLYWDICRLNSTTYVFDPICW